MRHLPHLATLAGACLLSACLDAMAQSPVREFNIPAGNMKTAIDTYASQSGVQLLYKVAEVDGLVAKAVKGRMAPEAALSRLLEGTPLHVVRDGANAVVILRRPTRPAARATVGTHADAAQVVVRGSRGVAESARDRKRDSDAIVDAIIADDIARLPDQDAAQAAQRIPGVQVRRYLEEGGAFAIRGLTQTKVLLNGLETYGAKAQSGEPNGRNLDLEDFPAYVLAGIDVSKTSSANDIEGGLGGSLNIRTRQPFDFQGATANVTIKATNYRMAPGFGSRTRMQASGLLSKRWNTRLGEVGVLINFSHAGSVFGLTEDEVQRPRMVDNFAGSGRTVAVPIGIFTGNGHHGERERDSHVAAFQWRPAASVSLYANYFGMRYLLDQRFQTARFYTGTPTGEYSLWGDHIADGSDNLRSATFAASSMNSASVVGDEGRRVRLYDLGGQWGDGGALTVRARLSHNDTTVRNTLLEWGTYASIPTMRLAVNDGAASRVAVSGVDLADPANYRPAYLLSIAANGTQKNTAATLDATVRVDHPAIRSVEAGLRLNDYVRQAFGYVHLYCIDSCNGGTSLAALDPALLYQVPGVQSREVGPYPSFSTDAVRQQAALRALYGLPGVDANMPEYAQRDRERSLALYVKLNFATSLAGYPVSGNAGVRHVGVAAAGMLPSLNAKIHVRDDLLVRLAASKSTGPVSFSYLSPNLRILNPVQHDAEQGNPRLQPYVSRNLDVSIERYVGEKGMASLSMFQKLAAGLIQTVPETHVIDGEAYNVSTFRSAGLARIRGAEISYQQFFGSPGVQGSCTLVATRAPSSIAGLSVPLVGLSKDSCSLVGLYDRGGVKARLAYTHHGGYVATTSSSGAQGVPVFAKPFGTLDFALGYDVGRQLTLMLDGANLTGAHIEEYYGVTHRQMNYVPLNKRYGVQMRYVF